MSDNRQRIKPSYYKETEVEENHFTAITNVNELKDLISTVAPLFYYHTAEEDKICSPEWYLQKSYLVNKETTKKLSGSLANSPVVLQNQNLYFVELQDKTLKPTQEENESAKTFISAKVHSSEVLDLQFWFFYANRGAATANIKWLIDDIVAHNGKASLRSTGSFQGDWKELTLRVNVHSKKVEQIYFPNYKGGSWLKWEELEKSNHQAKIYISKSSHDFFPGIATHTAEILKFNLFTSSLEFALKQETDKGESFNSAHAFELLSAPFIINEKPIEPAWLNFSCPWGKLNFNEITREEMKSIIKSSFGTALEFLLSKQVLDEISDYLLNYSELENRVGVMGPKFRDTWNE
jgi:hypothetical protein